MEDFMFNFEKDLSVSYIGLITLQFYFILFLVLLYNNFKFTTALSLIKVFCFAFFLLVY